MKIISGFKDYYDFVQGQYGIDPSITYERHFQMFNSVWGVSKNCWEKISINHQPKLKHLQTFMFAICGKFYFVANLNDTLYFGRDAFDHLLEIKSERNKILRFLDQDLYTFDRLSKLHLQQTDINYVAKCPILLCDGKGRPLVKNPRLADFGFPKIIEPQNLFISITQFLTCEPTVIDSRTDVQHLEAAGFNKITSFRNM